MTPLDRLKLSREDFDIQERLYNTIVLSIRFFVGTAVLLGGWSLSLFKLDVSGTDWPSLMVVATAVAFWCILLATIYQLFQLFQGKPWTIPRTLHHYMQWENDRLKQVQSGEFDTGTTTAEELAEREMVDQMTSAYADCADINRTANLERQRRVTALGKLLLMALIALGMQGVSSMIYSHHNGTQSRQPIAETATTTATTPGAGGHN